MDRPASSQKSSLKRTMPNNNKKKAAIKVVYISNPVRVSTSVSEFRAVVQELTGRDSDVAENIEKYATAETTGKPDAVDPVRYEQQGEVYKDADCSFEMPVLDRGPGHFVPAPLHNYQDGFLWSFFDG